jgi:hypothetical protein
MKMKEIATKINAYLKRFENDKEINKVNKHGLHPYFCASAYYERGPRIMVRFVSFQNPTYLNKQEAMDYLEWLDSGNVGTYYTMKYDREKA